MTIVFSSQRGGNADLATHLLNGHDNEHVEVLEIKGGISDDLHGVMEEWDFQRRHLTKSENGMMTTAINPDMKQGPWTREMAFDFVNRLGVAFGLQDQSRVVVEHYKENKDGIMRQHFHVAWNRVDDQNGRVIPIAFDRFKSMGVTRAFCADYGLALSDGYFDKTKNFKQLTLNDITQHHRTGISREERIEFITDLWRSCDSPKALVAALHDNGYILSQGRNPYVLVDIFGGQNKLARMVEDAKQKDITAFLEKDFPHYKVGKDGKPIDNNDPNRLPTVDEAKAKVKDVAKAFELADMREVVAEKLEQLKIDHGERRAKFDVGIQERKDMLAAERERAFAKLDTEKDNLLKQHKTQDMEVNFRRTQNDPRGLAKFLSKVSGVEFVRKKLHAYQDQKRSELQETARMEMQTRHDEARSLENHRQHLHSLEIERKTTSLERVFERETRSIEFAHQRDHAMRLRRGHEHMPSVDLALSPFSWRPAMTVNAKQRFHSPTAKEVNRKAKNPTERADPLNKERKAQEVREQVNFKPPENAPEDMRHEFDHAQNQELDSDKAPEKASGDRQPASGEAGKHPGIIDAPEVRKEFTAAANSQLSNAQGEVKTLRSDFTVTKSSKRGRKR